jgi:4-hydroxyphenylpyruvate dioxygenase
MAAKHGIEGIELFYEDLVDHSGSDSPSALLAGAASVRDLCSSLGLEIICLQPFMHYEGLLDRQRHQERIQEMKLWIELAKVLQTDIIQVPATFLPPDQTSSDTKLIVSDLQEIADLGLQQSPVIRFAYESLCWSTHVNKWETCWDIVSRVGRPNFGICLDSFNILGRIYADPAVETGKVQGAEKEVCDSIQRLVEQIKPHREKIFFIQIVDAERLERPLIPGHPFYNVEQPARMSWSRNCRLFYGETARGAYLPVRDVAHAIIKEIGYDGWVSMELFNRVMNSTDNAVVEELAERAALSWKRLQHDLELVGGVSPDLLKSVNVQDRKGQENSNFSRETDFARL